MRIAVLREITPGETRVALIPETVGRLVKAGHRVTVERGAGVSATFADDAYREAGATIADDARGALEDAQLVAMVREPAPDQVALLPANAIVIGFLRPGRNAELLRALGARGIQAFAMERVPRITRAQKMDALSSMSTVAGYKAVLLAADTLGKFFPLFMTAAGTVPPARVFILGAGVAGLQAIATARRLGAVVEAFDVRPAVRDEVQSLGATFVSADLASAEAVGAGGYAKEQSEDFHRRERELLAKHVAASDIVITTAMIPDKPAPRLISADMVASMRPGSVIVDMAAESGGNCELTVAGQRVVQHGVVIEGPLDLVTGLPVHASMMYSRNVMALIQQLSNKDGSPHLDFSDEITRGACVTGVPAGAGAASSAAATPPTGATS